jgi:hypothetical protein
MLCLIGVHREMYPLFLASQQHAEMGAFQIVALVIATPSPSLCP